MLWKGIRTLRPAQLGEFKVSGQGLAEDAFSGQYPHNPIERVGMGAGFDAQGVHAFAPPASGPRSPNPPQHGVPGDYKNQAKAMICSATRAISHALG